MSLKKATLLNAIAKYTTVVLQLIYTAILSRLLTPEDYGVVAIILVFIVFFQLFADMGLGTGVVQNKELTKKETNDIFSYMILLSFFCPDIFTDTPERIRMAKVVETQPSCSFCFYRYTIH